MKRLLLFCLPLLLALAACGAEAPAAATDGVVVTVYSSPT